MKQALGTEMYTVYMMERHPMSSTTSNVTQQQNQHTFKDATEKKDAFQNGFQQNGAQ